MLSSDAVLTPAHWNQIFTRVERKRYESVSRSSTPTEIHCCVKSLHFCLKQGQIYLDGNEKISRVGGYSTNLCLCGVNTATTTPPSITPVPEAPPTGSSDESASLHIRKINPASRAFQATPPDHFGSPVSGFPNALSLSVWLYVSQPQLASQTTYLKLGLFTCLFPQSLAGVQS